MDTLNPTPAERYAAAKKKSNYPKLRSFQERYDFPFDEFQLDAARVLEDGHGVLVAAPTGSGKSFLSKTLANASSNPSQAFIDLVESNEAFAVQVPGFTQSPT